LAEVGILIIDDDIVSQRALKHILDSEGWRVRIVPLASHALAELASGQWDLVVVNIALTDLRGPLFSILKELAQADTTDAPEPQETSEHVLQSLAEVPRPHSSEDVLRSSEHALRSLDNVPQPSNDVPDGAVAVVAKKRLRVLFLVPLLAAKHVQPILEQEGLPYSPKPYHLHDFLEKVSELLLEAGAITEPIRSIGSLSAGKKRVRARRVARDSRRGTMFASREDYQMSEEELVEWEKQEEEERKKREKEKKDREHL